MTTFLCDDCGKPFKAKVTGIFCPACCRKRNGYKFGEWIPVSERLPEKGQNVIALGSRGGVYVAQYKGSRYWHKLNARCHMCEPTHWMPLPNPPKENADEVH